MRVIAAALLCLTVWSTALPARGADLMLLDPPRTSYVWWGLLSLGLSAGAFNVARNGYDESEKALDKAKASYELYRDAGTQADADKYHKQTTRYRRQAVSFESTANAAVFIGVVFFASGVYSFFADADNSPLLISYDRVGWEHRF